MIFTNAAELEPAESSLRARGQEHHRAEICIIKSKDVIVINERHNEKREQQTIEVIVQFGKSSASQANLVHGGGRSTRSILCRC